MRKVDQSPRESDNWSQKDSQLPPPNLSTWKICSPTNFLKVRRGEARAVELTVIRHFGQLPLDKEENIESVIAGVITWGYHCYWYAS